MQRPVYVCLCICVMSMYAIHGRPLCALYNYVRDAIYSLESQSAAEGVTLPKYVNPLGLTRVHEG